MDDADRQHSSVYVCPLPSPIPTVRCSLLGRLSTVNSFIATDFILYPFSCVRPDNVLFAFVSIGTTAPCMRGCASIPIHKCVNSIGQ